jgi:hypothetical protein
MTGASCTSCWPCTTARALGAFSVLVELLERGQKEGVLRKRPLTGQAAASWQVHGITMLSVEGLFVREKLGRTRSTAHSPHSSTGFRCDEKAVRRREFESQGSSS